jgi:hypothetical protein
MDALQTQHSTAARVTEAGADYVLTVKANQKSLYARLRARPWVWIPAVTSTDRGHGRATRTLKAIDVPAWIDFTQPRRSPSCDLITSEDARTAPPELLAT